jgi:hypothetical protein
MKKTLAIALALVMALSMVGGLAFFQLPTMTDLTDQFDLVAVRAIDGTGLQGIRSNYEIVDATRVFVYDEVISVCATVQVANWWKNYAALAFAKEDYQLVLASDTINFGSYVGRYDVACISQIYSPYLGVQNAKIQNIAAEQVAIATDGSAVTLNLSTELDTISGTANQVVYDYAGEVAGNIVRLNGQYGPASIQYHYIVNGVTKAPATGVEGHIQAYLIAKPAETFVKVNDGLYTLSLASLNLRVNKHVKGTENFATHDALYGVFQSANMVRTGAVDFAGQTFTWGQDAAHAAPSYAFYELIDTKGTASEADDDSFAIFGTEILNNYNYYMEQGLGVLAMAEDAATYGEDWMPAVLTMPKVQVSTETQGLQPAAYNNLIQKFLAVFGMNVGLGDIKYIADSDFTKLGAEAVLKSQCEGTYKYGNSVEIVEEVVDEPTEEEPVEEEPVEEEPEEEEPVVATGDASASAAVALIATAIVAAAALAFVVKKAR